ncbi:uncharacterized protein A4U43_C02F7680 [Asparagus officinalis]|uniref:AIPP2-like SPOC-like domain-containing protein n=1 Tax=Asparagus officinalis TaxID=4686 RepID=A0A5P1FHK3_ASPOF|nr:uncharacterized protein LOC109830384 [Asparagus officinalis]ONK77544.1 uncharacterized protein A4U43_C02F7680 [Asparagus officinalis]
MEVISLSPLGRILSSLDRNSKRESESKEMPPICHKCGVTGYPQLFLRCRECRTSVEHIYCLTEFPIVEKSGWICELCRPRSFNITNDDSEHIEQQIHSDSNLSSQNKRQKSSRGKFVPYTENNTIVREVSLYTSPDEGEGRKSKRRRLILADEDSLDQKLQPDQVLTEEATKLPSGQILASPPLPTVSSDEVTIGSRILAHKTSTSEPTVQEEVQDDCAGHAQTKKASELPSEQVLASSPLHTVFCDEVTIGSQIDARKTSTSEAAVQEKVQDNHSPTKKAAELSSEQNLASPPLQHTVSSDEITIGSRIVTHEEVCTSEATVLEKVRHGQSNEHLYSIAQPIAGHVWRGYISFGDDKYGPLTAHLSSMACQRVYRAAKLLPSVLHMERLSRLEFCPSSFKNSPPTDEKIGLYFLPGGKMIEPMCDHLVDDAIQKDLLFKCMLGEVELLVFSSTILPRHSHRFLGKYYLWGAFRRRQALISTSSADIRPKPTEAREGIQMTEVSIEYAGDEEEGLKSNKAEEEIERIKASNERSRDKEEFSKASGAREEIQRMEAHNEHLGDEEGESLDGKSPDYSTSPHSVLEHPTSNENKLTNEIPRSKTSSICPGGEKGIKTDYKKPVELEEGEICDMEGETDYKEPEELEEGEICDMEGENSEEFDDDDKYLQLFPQAGEDMGIVAEVGSLSELSLQLGLNSR